MSERRLVCTLSYGPFGAAMAELSLPWLHAYARRCGADFRVLSHVGTPPLDDRRAIHASLAAAMLEKMAFLQEMLRDYDRVLWIDLDILVRPDAPNLFDLVPPGQLALADECAVANDYQIYFCHQHMVETCRQEGLPIPDTKGRYFNCGLMLLPTSCRWLFAPRVNPVIHPWCEQSLVNVRLFLRPKTPIYVLPECCNRFMYWPGLAPRRPEDMSWFLHFAGAPDCVTRLRDMASVYQRWRLIYPELLDSPPPSAKFLDTRKILGVGLSRTGTQSLAVALERLGYRTLHYPHQLCDIHAYDAATEVVFPLSVLEKAFPQSRYILTTRAMESWLRSCRRARSLSGPEANPSFLPWSQEEEKWPILYQERVAECRALLRGSGRLLEWDLCGQPNWDFLCRFLDKPAPEEPFPHRDRLAGDSKNG